MKRTSRIALIGLLVLALLIVAACQRERPATEGEEWTTPGSGTVIAPAITGVAPALTAVSVGTPLAAPQVTASGFVTSTLPTGGSVAAPTSATPGSDVVVVGPTYGYVVASGDTLYSIAESNGTDVNTLRLLNNLTGDALQVGQVLIVPGSGTGTAAGTTGSATTGAATGTTTGGASGDSLVYTVAAGDSLSEIAARYNVTWDAIAQANGLAAPYTIYRGQKLTIPGATASGSAGSTGTTTDATPEPGTTATHTVQPGETLTQIAAQYGTTAQAIMQANGIADPDYLSVGQELVIPQE